MNFRVLTKVSESEIRHFFPLPPNMQHIQVNTKLWYQLEKPYRLELIKDTTSKTNYFSIFKYMPNLGEDEACGPLGPHAEDDRNNRNKRATSQYLLNVILSLYWMIGSFALIEMWQWQKIEKNLHQIIL